MSLGRQRIEASQWCVPAAEGTPGKERTELRIHADSPVRTS